MKQVLLLILCLLIFISCATDSYRTENQHSVINYEYIEPDTGPYVKNIILLIGDGMGIPHIYAGMTANRGELFLNSCKNIGLIQTFPANDFVPDSGAAGTSISTGEKTNNGSIAVDTEGNHIKTILELAEENGLSTGLISTKSITDATTACFIAHIHDRDEHEQIAEFFLQTPVDVFIGGGYRYFSDRSDERDLIYELIQAGYALAYTMDEVINHETGKLAAFLAEKNLESYISGRGDMLVNSLLTGLKVLNENEKGFFLILESAKIDSGGHKRDIDYVVEEMLDFDRVIGKALEFAVQDKNTLVIITSDHETGGMIIIDGNIEEGIVEAEFITKNHTGNLVPVFAFGPKAETFTGIYDNTELFLKMLEAYDSF